MLDHLKAIANLSDVNKMNAYNLAVCFGPVLMSATTGNSAVPSGGGKDKRGSKAEKGGRGDGGRNSTDYEKHIEVLQSMIEIWPGRRGESGNCGNWSLPVTLIGIKPKDW